MGKIYQPEVAADAIVYMAAHRRRSISVGYTTATTIIGNKLFPALGDKILAKQGYEGQLAKEPEEPGRMDNLWNPVDEDRGSHGRFDDLANKTSVQFKLSTNRSLIWTASIVLLAAAVIKIFR